MRAGNGGLGTARLSTTTSALVSQDKQAAPLEGALVTAAARRPSSTTVADRSGDCCDSASIRTTKDLSWALSALPPRAVRMSSRIRCKESCRVSSVAAKADWKTAFETKGCDSLWAPSVSARNAWAFAKLSAARVSLCNSLCMRSFSAVSSCASPASRRSRKDFCTSIRSWSLPAWVSVSRCRPRTLSETLANSWRTSSAVAFASSAVTFGRGDSPVPALSPGDASRGPRGSK
mmetsp:Transcript_106466/g.237653  ORF Transcript_106466/g.237653 Transcript_106466/m.237653 type:complete len:233 (+) Transcript_106466:178-876(+)